MTTTAVKDKIIQNILLNRKHCYKIKLKNPYYTDIGLSTLL